MKWTLKELQVATIQHRMIDGVLHHRTITTYGGAEVTLDDDGITEMAFRALRNATGRAQEGHLKAKALARSTEASDWEAQ